MKKRNTNANKAADIALNPCFRDGLPVPSADLPAVVRRLQDGDNRVLLSISGKDSLATWLFLREHDFEVVPYFCYSHPDLSFDVEWIAYLEDFFKVKIYRFLHPANNDMLDRCNFQPPQNVGLIYRLNLVKYDYAYLENMIKTSAGIPLDTFSAVGIRAKDNMMRNRLVHQMGPLGLKKRHYWWAIWDFSQDDVVSIIRRHGVKVSRAYEIWGATSDPVDYLSLKMLREKSPADFEKMKQLFPLIEAEFFRFEQVK